MAILSLQHEQASPVTTDCTDLEAGDNTKQPQDKLPQDKCESSPSDSQKGIVKDQERRRLKHWIQEVRRAKEHGGDFQKRNDSAIRACLGSLIIFSALVFPGQKALGAVWIGNVFMHFNIKDSFGACLDSVRGFSISVLLTTTCVALPISILFGSLGTTRASILLPFTVFALAFMIMSCPQLPAGRNLMVLITYIIIATPIHDTLRWWQPLGWAATFLFGLAVAVLVNVFPKPNLALTTVNVELKQLENDFSTLLHELKHYMDDEFTPTPSESSSAIVASIEMLHDRIGKSEEKIKSKLAGAKTELALARACRWKMPAPECLAGWVKQTEEMNELLDSLHTALRNRLPEEDLQVRSPSLLKATRIFNEEVATSRDNLIDVLISSVSACHAAAMDSLEGGSVVLCPKTCESLELTLTDSRKHFHRAIETAAKVYMSQQELPSNLPTVCQKV